ncbi:SseB family protein [Streptomyces sp. SID3343]|nr:SseB family protein [Streptomyces sp. SID3343]
MREALRAARLYCAQPESPGFGALGVPGDGMVPVFTSLEQLARFAGQGAWFSTLGSDLLDLLPPGYDLGLDLAGPQPYLLSRTLWTTEDAPAAAG